MCELLTGRSYYKPFKYPEFYDRWEKHERSHWLPHEVQMLEDVNDWKTKLTDSQKNFLTDIFRFFTQGDVDVAGAYCTEYLPNFYQNPEIGMFLCSVAAREAVHIASYSHLIETLGMPESTYQEFLKYNEMKEKQSYIKKYQNINYGKLGNKLLEYLSFFIMILLIFGCYIFHMFNYGKSYTIFYYILFVGLAKLISLNIYNFQQSLIKEHIAAGIALFSGFTEGMQLFSSFTMLLSFPLNGLMKGMGQIITWSIVDETQHTEGMIELFKIFCKENTTCKCKYINIGSTKFYIFGCSCINKNRLKTTIKKIALKMVELEDNFIDLVYKEYSDEEKFLNISKKSLKKYIRFIANKRLNSMGYNYAFDEKINPLPEFEVMINAPINTNFFENRNTEYSKINNQGWENVWKK